MKDITKHKCQNKDKTIETIIFIYNGEGDPVHHLDSMINEWKNNDNTYREFIDMNMDNPWVRILVKGI